MSSNQNVAKNYSVKLSIILLILLNSFTKIIQCQTQNLRNSSSIALTQNIIMGLFTFTYVPNQLRYDSKIYFNDTNLSDYRSLLYVRNITEYHGQSVPQDKLNTSLTFISGAIAIKNIPVKTNDLWGYNFTLRRKAGGSFLNITLQIGVGVSFKQFTVGYLLSKDPQFVVGVYDSLYEKCPVSCPITRQWPISMVIASPPEGSIFIPLIATLKVHGPQPSFKFKDISTQMLNQTHRILYLTINLESVHTIEDISFAYIAHAQNQVNRYALKVKRGIDTKANQDGVFYALVELNGIIDVLLETQPDFFSYIGLSVTPRFFIQ